MEEKLEQLGLNILDGNVPPKVYSISLDPSVYGTHATSAIQSQFDKLSKLNPKHKKNRKWLSRPPVEQGPIEPTPNSEQQAVLKPVSLAEMATKVNQEWAGHVFYGRTMRKPLHRSNAMWTLIQDSSNSAGDKMCLPLSLWNYLPLHGLDDFQGDEGCLEFELPLNGYVAIRNPVLVSNTVWDDQDLLMIRCDNPQCIHVFSTEDECKRFVEGGGSEATKHMTAVELKAKGNEAFGKKAYRAAIRLYHQALSATPDSAVEISCLGNMAEAYLQSEQYDRAAEHAQRILKDHDPNHLKAQFRLARALLHRNEPSKAKDILLELRKTDSNNKSLQPLIGDCLAAIMEQSMGRYNIRNMLGETSLSPVLSYHANYVCPKISLGVNVVRPADGETYRGVLAKDDIAEGTLLTSTRAFAFSYHQQGGSKMDSTTRAAQKRHLYEVTHVHQAVEAVMNSPSLSSTFYSLEAAGDIHDSADGNHNEQPTIDIAKIRSILSSNRFGVDWTSPSTPFELKPPVEEGEEDAVGIGLWLDTSMFNHSCTPNCTWAPIGNQMFVYASKDIKQGEELCVSYVHTALSYEDRKDKFARWSEGKGFACGCELCNLLRSNEELRSMNEEVVTAQKRLNSGQSFNSIDDLLSTSQRERIKQAHHALPDRFKQSEYNIHMMEALQLANDGDRQGALRSVKAATSLGYAIRGGFRQETRVQDLCCLVAAHMVCNEGEAAGNALEKLCQHQVLLPSLRDFQTFVMMSSMPFWKAHESEQLMTRWSVIIKDVWENRSKQLR